MRGGHGGGGFHGGPSGGGYHGAPAGGYHGGYGGYHSAPSHGYYGGSVYRTQPHSTWSVGFSFGYGGFYGHAGYYPYYRHYHYYPYVYPYAYSPYVYAYPYYGVSYYDPGSYSYYSYADSNAYAAQQQQNQQLNAQIYNLNQQVDDLRQQNDDLRDYVQRTDKYSRPPVPKPPDRTIPQSLSEPVQREAPLTILVFRDGRRVETRNYAIVGNTVWVLSEQRSEKIPLAQLDLDKTQQENEQRGVEFTAPTSK